MKKIKENLEDKKALNFGRVLSRRSFVSLVTILVMFLGLVTNVFLFPIQEVRAAAIDIGPAAIDRTDEVARGYTDVWQDNPANDTGTITSIEIYAVSGYNLTDTKAGTFSRDGSNCTPRDYETIGDVTAGSKQTFSGLDIDVVSGDYIGTYFSDPGRLEGDDSDGGVYEKSGDQFDAGEQTYTYYSGWTASVYGTGATLNTAPTASTISETSTSASPTNVGSNVTFSGTITDPDEDQITMKICDSSGLSGTSCVGTQYCSDGPKASGSSFSCDYQAQDADPESNTWTGWACDVNNACTNMTEDDGTFYVNHAPEFTGITEPSADPGTDNITITSTATDDARDTNGQVKLYVCKSNDFSGGACGGGGEWTTPSAYADNNPAVTFTSPDADGQYDFYPYIIDNHSFASDGAGQGVLDHFTVNNKAPTVSSVSLNSGTSFSITVNSSSDISATATIQDDNGCTIIGNGGNEIASAKAVFFQDDLETSACTTDENDCYIIASCSLGGCSDGSLTATCTATMWYNANPTDNGAYATNQTWNADKWTAWVEGKDDDLATGNNTNSGETVDVNTTEGLDITEASIDYPNLNPGQSTVIANNDSVTTNSVGNCPIDNNIHGSTVLTKGSDTISNSNQRYGLTNADWASLSDELQDTATLFELSQTTKTTAHASPVQETIYFGLNVPTPQASGTYEGVNTFAAVEKTTF